MQLSSRPLTESDDALYVERTADSVVKRAVQRSENVLLGAVRGAGATSMLYRLERSLPDAAYVAGERADSPAEIVASVASRLRLSVTLDLGGFLKRPDPLAAPPVLRQIRSMLEKEDRHPTVLLDGPVDPKVAFELFGRWRDDLFALPLTWVVVGHVERLAEYLSPPADVFFDEVTTLDPFDEAAMLDLLRRRGEGSSDDSIWRMVSASADGTPRHVIRLARQHLTAEPSELDYHLRRQAQATAHLPPSAHTLLAEMQGRGPVAATDQPLLARIGVSDRQLRRSLAELERAGLVEPIRGARSRPGRPPATYRLTRLGELQPADAS